MAALYHPKLLLQENLTYDNAKIVLEEKIEEGTANKALYMKGIFIQGGIKNHNQRVYPVNEIRRAVEDINSQIRNGDSILGQLDHPEELNINLDRVSHVITEMYMDGPNGCGSLKLLPTPMGNIAKTLLESKVRLGVSSRGSGNVTESGDVSDFEMVTLDIVAKPSAPAAFPQFVVMHETYNSKRGKIIKDLAESVNHDRKAQKYLKEELLGWINNLK